jgi:predicted MFS family arabinose efflux permease
MTDRPSHAAWLDPEEQRWLANELQTELEAKKKLRNYTIKEAFCDRHILTLITAYFLALTGSLGTIYWIPTFVKRISGFSNQSVTSLLLIPAFMGFAGMLLNGWHSDKTAERHWHSAAPLLLAVLMFSLLILFRHNAPFAIAFLLLGSGVMYAYFPTFWAIPTMMLGEAAAAATFGLINSIGQLGGLFGNYTIGFLNDETHSLTPSFGFIAFVYLVSGTLIVSLRTRRSRRSDPMDNAAQTT